jgi:hypothetical protein
MNEVVKMRSCPISFACPVAWQTGRRTIMMVDGVTMAADYLRRTIAELRDRNGGTL